MIDVATPEIRCLEEPDNPSYGKFIVEPLWEEHGRTLGNAMRRILLSSLPGTAVTSIKIKGILHEFTTIPGVKEDVPEIVLNVKSIIAKLHSNGVKTALIEVAGECEVTAGDIKSDLDVEILNPDLHIATLGPEAMLSMELTLAHGRGYVPAEQNKSPVLGCIPVDSLYNPVQKVRYDVNTLHTHNISTYDRLTLEVWTDGTITARDAVALSGRILHDHFSLFTNSPEYTFGATGENSSDIFVEKPRDVLDMSIADMDFSVRAGNCLRRAGIGTLRELVSKTEEELARLRGMGRKSLEEIIEKVSILGFSITPSENEYSKYQ